jgi:hypothetical protein
MKIKKIEGFDRALQRIKRKVWKIYWNCLHISFRKFTHRGQFLINGCWPKEYQYEKGPKII